jgi:predicted TIM-barrel fold metal-dependent hydrolase
MKIVCLEEHTHDAAVAKATLHAAAKQAPYMADLGSEYQEEPSCDRPSLQAPQRAVELASEPVENRLSAMNADRIDMQVLSDTNSIQSAPVDSAVELACAVNDRLADAVAKHPHRFAAFSTLPWQDPDDAVRELERTVSDLGLTATMLLGHPGEDVFLDDPRYAQVLAKLEQLSVPIYIHPGPPLPEVQRPYYSGFGKEVTARLSLYGWGWHNEAGVQVLRLILSGALDRHPGLRIISGHWGEMVPFFLQRLDDSLPPAATGLSRTISQTYREQVFVTPSGMFYLPHFLFVREVLGAGRIMFSVDYPYVTMTGARRWLENLPIDDAERTAIAHATAERLLHLSV